MLKYYPKMKLKNFLSAAIQNKLNARFKLYLSNYELPLFQYKAFMFNFQCLPLLLKVINTNREIYVLIKEVQKLQERIILLHITSNYIPTLPTNDKTTSIYTKKKLSIKEIEKLLSSSEKEIFMLSSSLSILRISRALQNITLEIQALTSEFWVYYWVYNYLKAGYSVHTMFKNTSLVLRQEKSLVKYTINKLNLIVYTTFYKTIWKIIHIFEKTTFVYGIKYIFNKKYLFNKEEPKYIKVEPSAIIVPGYSIQKRYIMYPGGKKVFVKSKILHHKYDFNKKLLDSAIAISDLRWQVYRIECNLYAKGLHKLNDNK